MLDDDRPYVYCVAGRRHRIVLTTEANRIPDPEQLTAVLARTNVLICEVVTTL
ncbi:hypothetical protein [Jiangella muralis]|uniref:hypothetical protein n=1 Tax=Jiangella muralis TaxID=702383 RepID=UPI0012F92C66|nr:hypothetical protein [Jiangella muralis]